MDEDRATMSIGRFSSLSRISVRMLRHYAEHLVLLPADTDPLTGYRRYSASQLIEAREVRRLRDVGFNVSAIASLLAARHTPEWTRALQAQRDVLEAELQMAQERVSLITRMLTEGDHCVSQTPQPNLALQRRTVPPMTVAALRGTVAQYENEGQLWERMMPLVHEQGVVPVGPCGVIEHDAEYKEHDVDLSIFLPVEPGTSVQAPLTVIDLPSRDCVVVRVNGGYDQIAEAHDLISDHLAVENLAPASADSLAECGFTIYLTTPDQAAEADLVTDVCVPLAR